MRLISVHDSKDQTDESLTSNVDEGVKGKPFPRFHSRASKAFIEDEMFGDTSRLSREWTESAAKERKEHQEKKKSKGVGRKWKKKKVEEKNRLP